ncbi:MAG: PmoA family protein, partial [Armatimonadetes bacterium]|nr:PmoA family protein [Armatimonadota bacterium]
NTEKWVRPFLYPVLGPFGHEVTRQIPGGEGPDFDHVHHKSIYVAHGDVNGANCWDEMPGHGFVKHVSFKKIEGGAVFGEISHRTHWTDNAGTKLCEQTSNLRFYNLPANLRLIDYVVKFHATEGDLHFGDTKEGGILSLRVQPTMNVTKFGRMENGYGAVNEAECWGKRAPWCDYSGPAFGEWVGITYMNHPSSFRSPTYWHARDYGLMTANPFGLSSFIGEGHDGSHTVPAGESLVFAYRIYIHPGDTAAGKVGDRFHDYVSPPKVELP